MIDKRYIYEKTKEYVPGWCFVYRHEFDKKHSKKEEVKVLQSFTHHVVVTNGLYNYSISRFDLYKQKCGTMEVANVK